jgi:hypothetical protein
MTEPVNVDVKDGGTVYFEARDRLTSLPVPNPRENASKNKNPPLAPASSDPGPPNAESFRQDRAHTKGGIHRFTMVNQKAMKKVEAAKAKKQSACTSWMLRRDPGVD